MDACDLFELVRYDAEMIWACAAVKAEFAFVTGRPLNAEDPADVAGALSMLRADLTSSLPREIYEDLTNRTEIEAIAYRLSAAISTIESAQPMHWSRYLSWRAGAPPPEESRETGADTDPPEVIAMWRVYLESIGVSKGAQEIVSVGVGPGGGPDGGVKRTDPTAQGPLRLPAHALDRNQVKWVWSGAGDTLRHRTVRAVFDERELQEARIIEIWVDTEKPAFLVQLLNGSTPIGVEDLWYLEDVELAPREPIEMFEVVLLSDLESFGLSDTTKVLDTASQKRQEG